MRLGTVSALAGAAVSQAAAAGGFITQLDYFATGFDESGAPLAVPSIDPSGVAWHGPSGHLFIVDSEINEVPEAFAAAGGNVFEISLTGETLWGVYDLTALANNEPTGIAFNAADGFFYVTNDDVKTLSRYSFDERGFAQDDVVNTLASAGASDPEDVAADPASGLLYVIDGMGRLIVVYSHGPGGFSLEETIDLAALNPPGEVPLDPEGIALDPETGDLFVVSDPEKTVYRYTRTGIFVERYDLAVLAPPVVAPQGLVFAPTSDPADDPGVEAIYLVDAGIDNNADPEERDGAVYEAFVGTPLNDAPIIELVPDQAVDEGATLALFVDASDVDRGDVLTFDLIGPVPSGAAIDAQTGALSWTPSEQQGPAIHALTVRVTDSGFPPLSDQASFAVTVSEVNEPPVLDPIGDRSVGPGETLRFVATATDPDVVAGLATNLVAHWPFDSDFTSTPGYYDGVPHNGAAVTTAPGSWMVGGGALWLDGINDHVFIPRLDLAGDLTIAAWVMPTNIAPEQTSEATLMGDANSTHFLRLEADAVRARWNNATALVDTDPDFVNGAWQHFAIVRSGGALTVYRNGQIAGTGASAHPFGADFIGHKESNNDYYGGQIDDLAVWTEALDGAVIADLYDDGAGRAASEVAVNPGNALDFALQGDVPPGAAIDPQTGEFTWEAPATSAAYTFSVLVTDDGKPAMSDQETITVTVIAPCPADLDDDGLVGITDLLALLPAWGTPGPGDIDGDGAVGIADLLELLAAWGPCP
jgi:DNA-binding beta-propeller fold protein YncE